MPESPLRPQVAIVSPFVDKRHGTELCLAEQIEHLATTFDIHLYSERVEDIDVSGITWHRVRLPPGPHLFRYVWWLFANHFIRWRDRKFRGVVPEAIYSPGVNCFDADLISVHEIFGNLRRQLGSQLRIGRNPWRSWPVLVHRRIYYWLAETLENRVYPRDSVVLTTNSLKISRNLQELYGLPKIPPVLYYGVDSKKFSPGRCNELRAAARKSLGLSGEMFAVLLIGNDWKKKGLPCLLEALGILGNPHVRVLVIGKDAPGLYLEAIRRLGLIDQVSFLPSRPDVEAYYAAADVCAMPSMEEAFSLPPAEAMSCGLPVIVSRAAGVSEIIHHGEDGLVLENPADARTLSEMIGRLYDDPAWRKELGQAATKTAAQYTWESNARELGEILNSILETR